ncbi:putative polyketide synthase [Cercophora scortea]|uniref:Polyketide synthase n=1 Tax=Cercophora scortea TaxID=314031 RepID=A0AAE0I861_9PEZI|nr:putative polyketide synthase [Cercophora scortea]
MVELDMESIAVVGLSCRLPGEGNTLENFWQSICAGESAWSEIPKDRFNADAFWSPNKRRSTSAAKGAHFMREDLSRFDAGFFGLPKYDVDAMDPQQRIMMEVAYEALERAGIPLHKIAGTRTGVYMGNTTTDYRDMICRDLDKAPQYTFTGTCPASMANRISWLWDLRGPSFPVNTACSSSMVALHLACQSLRTGESDTVIVGASSLLLNPEMFIFLSNHGFLSPDGKCKSFDASANGYGRGEGFGCVILKRTSDAIAAGDPIRAVIRGTGSNQDGRTKGLTMPSAEAQMSLMEEIYQKNGLDFATTAYVEAHGTGTKVGDLSEMESLGATIAASHSPDNKLIVGSVKANIGHLEAAAGIASIIKAVLMLETGLIPPNINFNKPNPNIQWDKWNVRVPTQLTPWPTDGVRRISVNSFGYGGSNAHAVLDDAEHYLAARKRALNGHGSNGVNGVNGVNGHSVNGHTNGVNGHANGINGHANGHTNGHASNGVNGVNGHASNGINGTNGTAAKTNGNVASDQDAPRPHLFVWSAQDKDGLKRMEEPLAKYIEAKAAGYNPTETETFMAELAYTLGERRSRLQWKTFAIASSPEELAAALTASEDGGRAPAVKSSRSPRIGFVFTGQGAQWPRMGAELMGYKVFRESIQAADRHLQENCGCTWSVAEELAKNKMTSLVNTALYSHGLTSILQVALVDLLRSWNILPTAVVGHSGGEIAASYASGGLSRKDAWKVAYYRGYVASRMKIKAPDVDGSMMAVGLSQETAEEWISKVTDGKLVVACINSPTSTTIAGDSTGIDQLLGMLKTANVFCRKLMVDTAYHSPHMAILADEYRSLTADIKPILNPDSDCTMFSTVTGGVIDSSQLGVNHWVASITAPVQFSKGVHDMVRPFLSNGKRQEENNVDVLLELGPHSALQGPSTQSLKAHGIANIPYYSVLTRNLNAINTAATTAGALFTQGCQVNIREINVDSHLHFDRPLVDLPTYAWNHSQRFWHDSRVDVDFLARDAPKPGLLGAAHPSITEGERLWKGFLRLSEAPWISDHKIQGSVLYPGAGYIAMAIEAAVQTADASRQIASFNLRDIQLTAATIMTDDDELEYIVKLRPHVVGTKDSASTWTEFSVTTSPDGKSLVQNCCGLMIIEYEPAEGSDASRERDLEEQGLKAELDEAQRTCGNRLDPDGFYADMRSWGLDYGPVFTNVCEARNRDGQSVGSVRLPEVPIPGITGRPYVVHPGTLDAVFHLAFAAVKGGKYDPKTAMVPKSIDAVTISANIPYLDGTILPGFANADRHGLNELNADIVMFDDAAQLPTIVIRGFLCAEIAGASSAAVTKSITSKLTWKPAVGLLSPEDLNSLLSRLPTGEAKLTEYLELLHHADPTCAILEVAADAESPLFKQPSLATLAKTWDVDTAVQDKDLVKAEQQAAVNVLDFTQDLPEDAPTDKYDVLVASDDALQSYALTLEEAVGRMVRVVKEDGTLCFLTTENTLSGVQSALDASKLDVTVLCGTETGPSFVFAKKRSCPMANGITNGITNGVTNGTANGSTNGLTNGASHSSDPEVTIVLAANPTETALAVASRLIARLQKHHYQTRIFCWGPDVSRLAGKACISLVEFETPLLSDLAATDFKSLQRLILETESLFWVTALNDPSTAMIDGLVRVVRNETPGLNVRILHADEPASIAGPAKVQRLADLMSKAFLWTGEENEFYVKDDLLQICRLVEDQVLNEEINSLLPGTAKTITEIPLSEIKYPVKLCVPSPGMLSSVCMEPDNAAAADIEPEFIEIQTKATALNFREVMVAMGQMADTALGLDAAGIVRRVGSSVTKFKVGDKVIMCAFGAHRTFHRAPASFCTHLPEGMSFEEGASIPVVHATAWNALIRVAKVQKGQSILIHAAAGGVGQVACQIAQHFGMEVFATVSSETKKKLIREQYGIRDDHIFNSRDTSFVKGIKRMTNGRGVDVVLNSLAGEALRQTWHCIAPFGHFVEIGIKDILNNTGLEMRPFLQDATFTFFNLRHVEESRPDLMAVILEGAFDFIRRGITRPVEPLISFPISDVEGALRLMQTGKHLGKIALTWGDDHVVPVIQKGMQAPKLSPDGVYMLVGGLGGIGRSVASKLVSLGARKLCFLSRSGAESSKAQALVQRLEQQQVQVQVYKCDVGNPFQVATAVHSCTQELGKVRGVFQCAMVLRDGLFTNMTHQAWVEATRPKVQGSWNLHTYLPDDLDFFITLSSFTGVFGSRGQGNYSSAGAYEDALAYHRRARGQHATTIDLGLMCDIGVLAESGMTENASFREWEKPYGIHEPEFLALIERVIDRDTAATMPPQVVTGLATGGSVSLAGITTPYYLDDARFSIIARTGLHDIASSAGSGGNVPAHVLISQAKSMPEAVASVLEALVKQVAKMLQTDPSEVDTSRFLHSYGFDSLVAIEIVNWVMREAKSTITVFDVLAGVPITTLCNRIAVKSTALPKELIPV